VSVCFLAALIAGIFNLLIQAAIYVFIVA